MKNLGLIFNKVCYQKMGDNRPVDSNTQNRNRDQRTVYQKDLDERIAEICSATFDPNRDYKESEVSNEIFELKTAYPGLLIGTGNPHGADSYAGDIAAGFSFDYVTGQPYIPGSSVKGVLRSHFKQHPEAVGEIAQCVLNRSVDVATLEKVIFDGNDVFLDAVVSEGDASGHVIGSDYITPHSHPNLKNPTPIHILKVLPGVKLEFRFRLTGGTLSASDKLNASDKLKLFKELIVNFGVGAKTNVGYGILETIPNTQ